MKKILLFIMILFVPFFIYAESDAEYTLIDVVEAAKNAGVNSINVQTLRNFLILNDEYFDSDDYADFIDAVNEVKDLYIKDIAYALFYKTPDQLTESERYDVYDALSTSDKLAIFRDFIDLANDHGILITRDFDANGYPVVYGSIRGGGGSSGGSSIIYTSTSVIEALKSAGFNNDNVNSVKKFFNVNGTQFDSDDYEDFIDIIEEIKNNYIIPAASSLFKKAPSALTETERLSLLYGGGLSGSQWIEIRYYLEEIYNDYNVDWAYNNLNTNFPVWHGAVSGVSSLSVENNGYINIYTSKNLSYNVNYHSDIGEVPNVGLDYSYFSLSSTPFFGIDINSSYLPVLNYNGYEFKGWSLSEDSDEVITRSFLPYSENVNLYAVWEEHTHNFDSLISDNLGIHKSCTCGEIGESVIYVNNSDGISNGILFSNLFDENIYEVKYLMFDNKLNDYFEVDEMPVEPGKYKIILSYNSLNSELDYEINLVNPKTFDSSFTIILISLFFGGIVGLFFYFLLKNDNVSVKL